MCDNCNVMVMVLVLIRDGKWKCVCVQNAHVTLHCTALHYVSQ